MGLNACAHIAASMWARPAATAAALRVCGHNLQQLALQARAALDHVDVTVGVDEG
jgi:hypothetical protein